MSKMASKDAMMHRRADVVCFVASIVGGLLIDNDYRGTGWVLLFVSVACLFQRTRQLWS